MPLFLVFSFLFFWKITTKTYPILSSMMHSFSVLFLKKGIRKQIEKDMNLLEGKAKRTHTCIYTVYIYLPIYISIYKERQRDELDVIDMNWIDRSIDIYV